MRQRTKKWCYDRLLGEVCAVQTASCNGMSQDVSRLSQYQLYEHTGLLQSISSDTDSGSADSEELFLCVLLSFWRQQFWGTVTYFSLF